VPFATSAPNCTILACIYTVHARRNDGLRERVLPEICNGHPSTKGSHPYTYRVPHSSQDVARDFQQATHNLAPELFMAIGGCTHNSVITEHPQVKTQLASMWRTSSRCLKMDIVIHRYTMGCLFIQIIPNAVLTCPPLLFRFLMWTNRGVGLGA
jgi:hypothetical protein